MKCIILEAFPYRQQTRSTKLCFSLFKPLYSNFLNFLSKKDEIYLYFVILLINGTFKENVLNLKEEHF
ncbi:hypothetical protein CEH05_02885 [Halobacillus halophilus]|nr:hypothetical protein CEH05_02885 [Halobacillus halophilus]